MAGSETKEDIVQLVVAAYDAAPGAALMRELEAVIDERGGSLLDVAAALTSGERWEERYPASWTADRFADEWLGSLLPGADAALLAAAREIVVGRLDAGGGFAELVLAAQEYLSGPDVSARFAGAARSFLDRSEAAMAHSVVQGRDGSAAELREALALTAGGALGDYDGDGAADDGKTEAFDAAGRPVRVEYDFDSDGTVNRAETYSRNGAITTLLIELDDGKAAGIDGAAAGDGVFDSREQRTMVDGFTVRILVDADNDGAWDGPAELVRLGRGQVRAFGADGWLESIRSDDDGDGTYDWSVAYAFSRHENGGIKMRLADFSGAPGASTVERWLSTYDADGVLESNRFDDDGDGTYDRVYVFTYTRREGGGIETRLAEFDGGPGNGPVDGVVDGRWLETYYADGALESLRAEHDDDGDGAYDQISTDTYTYHENGKIKTMLAEHDDGSGGGIAADGVVDSRTLSTYGADGAHESAWFDDDGDGTYDRVDAFTYTRHESGGIETRLTETDGGPDRGPVDGVVDGRRLETYDAGGALKSRKWDSDGDGAYEGGNTFHENGEIEMWRTAFDGDGDGTYDRVEVSTYTYHENGRIKTRSTETDGGPGRGPVDGVVDVRTLSTYGSDGARESEKLDNDGDGAYEEVSTYHDNGRIETRSTVLDDGAGDGAAARRLVAYGPDGAIESVKRDRDGDGAYEEVDTYHDNGRLKTRLTEYGDGPGGARTLSSYDADGALWASWTDFDGDGTHEQTHAYAYRENGKLETMLVEYDDGRGGGTAGDGIVDRRSLIAYDADGAPETGKLDSDGDGTWDFTNAFGRTGTVEHGRSAFVLSIGPAADGADRAVSFTIAAAAGLGATADDGATRHEPGPGDDTITGGAGRDVFVFRRGDGADVIMDFDPRIDVILIKGAGSDSAGIELDALVLRAGEEAQHPRIPARLFPADVSAVDVAVLTYGGPDDRIIIVGGVGGSATGDFRPFPPPAGHEPDLWEPGG